MAIDYGYVIRITRIGIVDPSATYTRQWQRQELNESDWADISGSVGTTYTVQPEDRSCKIRLKQIFNNVNGDELYSNSLTVTSSLPPSFDLGTVTIAGKAVVETGDSEPYEVVWDGGVDSKEVTIQWATDAASVLPAYSSNPSNFTWDAPKDDAFVMAQVSCPKCTDKQSDMAEKPVKVEGLPKSGIVTLLSGSSFYIKGTVSGKKKIISPSGVSTQIEGEFSYTGRELGPYELPVRDITKLNFYNNSTQEFEFDPNFYTGNIQDMSCMFFNARRFNQDISSWDTSNVTNMKNAFTSAFAFNQDLPDWDTSKVTNMYGIFFRASVFNGSLANWDVSLVDDFTAAFQNAFKFNRSLNTWNPTNCRFFTRMFSNCEELNQDFDNWTRDKATSYSEMFYNCQVFNGNVSAWDKLDGGLRKMFYNCQAFNQDIAGWDVSNIATVEMAFFQCKSFNRPIPYWNLHRITSKPGFDRFFDGCTNLYQDFSGWCVSGFDWPDHNYPPNISQPFGNTLMWKEEDLHPKWGSPCNS